MLLRRAAIVLSLVGVISLTAWACESEQGPRDMHYGTDVGAGYTGPEGGANPGPGDSPLESDAEQ